MLSLLFLITRYVYPYTWNIFPYPFQASNARLSYEKRLWSTLKVFGKRISVGVFHVYIYKKKKKSCSSFSLRVWLEVLKESLERLSSYKSKEKNCLQCSLELVFSYSFISITLSLNLITSNKSPLDLSFAIMIVEMRSLCKLMVEISHLILWAKHIKTKHMCDWVHIPWEGR